ncbi:MAG: SAM-dependent methyltransferase [Bacteroidetes bacterium]|nr:MAG: SAM-dependent methyltransferase [Bacteroidota bacterium]
MKTVTSEKSQGERIESFNDFFSKQSRTYSTARPNYPDELFDFISSQASSHDVAWDCATGNGQAALSLVNHFKKVIATDASANQIKNAHKCERVEYRITSAEDSGLDDESVDVITVATAVHWLDLTKFYKEVNRVLKDDGIIFVWSYADSKAEKKINDIMMGFAFGLLKDYWPKETKLAVDKYKSLHFPFAEITAPKFESRVMWNLEETVNYLMTWSSVQRYIEATNSNPLDHIMEDLISAWGYKFHKKEISWDLYLKAGRKKKDS